MVRRCHRHGDVGRPMHEVLIKKGQRMERDKTILHVDDDPSQLRIVAAILEKHGYIVESVGDSTEALQRISELNVRLVLLDIDMPGIDGMTLLREIKRIDGGVQVIMVTGLVKMSTVLKSMRWGAEACVFKPITDTSLLLEAVDAAFEKNIRWWKAVDLLTREKRQTTAQLVASGSGENPRKLQ